MRHTEIGDDPRRVGETARRRAQGRRAVKHMRDEEQRRRPDQLLGNDAQSAFFGAQPEVDDHPFVAFADLDGERVAQDAFSGAFGDQALQAFGQPGVAAGRGQDGVAGGVLRLAVTAGEIVDSGPGRGGRARRAEVVAAGVVDVPVQVRRIKVLGKQPVAHVHPVKRLEIGGVARQGHRQREGAPSVVAALFEVFHQRVKALVLLAFGAADAKLRQDAFFPAAQAKQPFLRRGAQIALVVARPRGLRVALQHAKLGEQFAAGRRFARRQRQIVRRQRIGADRIAPAA